MLKYLALIFNTVALLIFQLFFSDEIKISQNAPASAKAESEFTVELKVTKGTTIGFAKLQVDLPAGFTATEDKSSGASFTFSNQSVKFIWMSLPSDKDFKISYKIKVASDVSGDKIIGGKFSYLADNVKQSFEIPPVTVNIIPLPKTEPPVAGNDQAASQVPAANTESFPITCIRKTPATSNGDFTVDITINKGNLSGFAKLIETLPPGFTATAIESKGASFTFTDQKAKFVWISMPAEPEFKLSYKVSVSTGTVGKQTIDGAFSYIENDETKKFILTQSSISIGTEALSQPIAASPDETKQVEVPKTDETKQIAAKENTETKQKEETKTVETKKEADKETTVKGNATKSLSATNIPAVQANVNYSVQIAALRKTKDANVLASLYKINEKINTEMAEGYTKYTVGSHSEYKSARDAREELKKQNVPSPWVTAYNGGKRVTVQEALMITNQKWFR